jgi:hypothetical protein
MDDDAFMSRITPMTDAGIVTRTVSADPGLLSHEELLARNGSRRRTLEELIAKEKLNRFLSSQERASVLVKKAKKKVRWFIDHAQIRISVSDQRFLSWAIWRRSCIHEKHPPFALRSMTTS